VFGGHPHRGARPPLHALDPEARRARILALHEGDPAWIGDVVRSAPSVFGPWPLHDIRTLPSWHAGRVCGIGDAAHATSPSAGQGASLAMEDAMMLARCLRDTCLDPERAFRQLESERRARVELIVERSRRYGSPKTPSGPVAAWTRDLFLPFFLKMGASQQRALYAYRIEWEPAAAA
jgi:2-polyprenyl-6-methoxyphenol hydroxylase-like FAD-dependent oxidoreductase